MTKGSYSGNDFFGRMELTYRVVARSSDAAISREIISIALLWLFSVPQLLCVNRVLRVLLYVFILTSQAPSARIDRWNITPSRRCFEE